MVQHFFYFPLESATEKKLSQLVGDRQTGELPTFGGVPTPLPEQVSDPFKYRESPEPVGFIGPPIPKDFEFPTGFDLPTGFPIAQPGPVQFQESIQVQSTADALLEQQLALGIPQDPPAAGSLMDILGWNRPPGPVQPAPRSANTFMDITLGMAQVIGGLAEPVVQPLDVLAQTASELVRLQTPTLVSEGYVASLDRFRNRPMLTQIGLGMVFDPFFMFKAGTIPLNVTRNLRTVLKVPVAYAAGLEFDAAEALSSGAQRLARLSADDYIEAGTRTRGIIARQESELGRPLTVAEIDEISKAVVKDFTPTAESVPYVMPDVFNNVINLRPIRAGLGKAQVVENWARSLLGKELKSDVSMPAMAERARVRNIVDSQANVAGATAGTLVRRFTLAADGTIPDLVGVDPTLPVAPTLSDVAANLTLYAPKLTGEQLDSLNLIRESISPYRSLREELGEEIGRRTDVMEGGFYIPRGRSGLEGADSPVLKKVGKKGQPSSDLPAVFDSQAEGISKGWEYAPFDEVIRSYVIENGNKALDQHISNYFKAATDELGDLIGETPKMRLLRQNPRLVVLHTAIVRNLNRLKNLKGVLNKQQQEVIDEFLDNPEFDDINTLSLFLRDVRVRGGPSAGMNIADIQDALTTVKADINTLSPEWNAALKRAKLTPGGQQLIDIPQLANRTFPDDIANSANALLKTTQPLAGPAVHAFNNLYRGLRATADWSYLGVQGLLGMASDPAAYAQAVKLSTLAWGPGGKETLGKFIVNYNTVALKNGRVTASTWAKSTLRVGGVETEFMLGSSTSFLSRLPVVRQANRAFGFFGDGLRLNWADDLLGDELRKGRSLADITASGDLERIAKTVNGATGWSPNKAFGSMGELTLFAPRFLQSRFDTLARAALGLIPGASLDQRIATKSMLKLVGYATVLTVAANWVLGEETDFHPFIDSKGNGTFNPGGYGPNANRINPNFHRIRFAERDISLLGHFDSFARAIIVTAQGKPQDALRGMGSGLTANAWNYITGETFLGEGTRDNPEQFGKRLLENWSPFAAEELPSAAQDLFRGETLTGMATILGELSGFKSSPITPTEARDIRRIGHLQDRGIDAEWQDVDDRIRRDIDKLPDVIKAKEAMIDRQRKHNSDYRKYADDRDDLKKDFKTHVSELADTFGPSERFRGELGAAKFLLAHDQDNLRGEYTAALAFFADVEESKSLFNQALEAYLAVTSNEELDHGVFGYNFALRDVLIQELIDLPQFSEELIEQVKDHLREDDHPLDKELRRDREVLRRYWEESIQFVKDYYLPPSSADIWDTWRSMPSKSRERVDYFRDNEDTISYAQKLLAGVKDSIQQEASGIEDYPTIDALLVKWEYDNTPETVEGLIVQIELLGQSREREELREQGITEPVNAR